MSDAISIQDLGFAYEGQTEKLFSQLNLRIAAGESFGLFGPNGAGKTTLMSLMTGLQSFKEGKIFINGQDIQTKSREVKRMFGFIPQDFSFYSELTPAENLAFFGAWSGLNRVAIKQRTDELLQILGLTDVRHKPVERFSGGMKRRVNLAIGVIHDPPILFLDEPTVGVDIQTRHAIVSYLKELNQQGTTLVYTSHQLHEAEELCRYVALIDHGSIVASDTLSNLLSENAQDGLEGLFLSMTGKNYRNADV